MLKACHFKSFNDIFLRTEGKRLSLSNDMIKICTRFFVPPENDVTCVKVFV